VGYKSKREGLVTETKGEEWQKEKDKKRRRKNSLPECWEGRDSP